MKKKIVFGLSIFALMFFLGGIYIVTTAETTNYELHQLSQLHNAASIRKDLLAIIRQNQFNIMLRRAYFIADPETSSDKSMPETVKKCLACHQSSSSLETINSLLNQLEMYQALTRYTSAAFPGSASWESRARAALQLGNDLVRQMEDIVKTTTVNLQTREQEILRKIDERKSILFLLVTVGPFFTLGLAFILIRGLTSPIKSLLAATRNLKEGDLDYRVRGLHDEFGELANSFNEMAESLKEQIQEMRRTEQLRVCGELAAGLAHEIRNPLAGMKISIELLLAELNIEERDRDVLIKVIEQIRHIELLMKDLLNYARPMTAQRANVNVNNSTFAHV
ncbi:MAG: HAMP domain-containing sensor histidine kinase [Smithella sp.]|nr:HAMP domain-containing sensor histidine kinase [Smithella sp.]